MSEIKDWRGTPITEGVQVIWHGESSYRVGILKVTEIAAYTRGPYTLGQLRGDWWEHKAHNTVKSKWLDIDRVTVLTNDMFPELIARIAELEGDIEFYQSELARDW